MGNTFNFQQQQPNSGNFNQQYQQSTEQSSQSFSGSNKRHQNYTCSYNQPSSWIRLQVQLQAKPVTLFSDIVSIETYALLDSGSDNTQITKRIAEPLKIFNRKSVTIPVSSPYYEHTIETKETFLGIGAIDNSRPIINLPVFATSTTDFQMPTVLIQMLISVCKDFGHLGGVLSKQLVLGAACSPYCFIYVLQKYAIKNHHLSPEAHRSKMNNVYTDNFLQSLKTKHEAIKQTTCNKETLNKEDSI